MKKYYIELATNSGDIILQSKWYEYTIEYFKVIQKKYYNKTIFKVEKRKPEYV